jgi:hypothetical protein
MTLLGVRLVVETTARTTSRTLTISTTVPYIYDLVSLSQLSIRCAFIFVSFIRNFFFFIYLQTLRGSMSFIYPSHFWSFFYCAFCPFENVLYAWNNGRFLRFSSDGATITEAELLSELSVISKNRLYIRSTRRRTSDRTSYCVAALAP